MSYLDDPDQFAEAQWQMQQEEDMRRQYEAEMASRHEEIMNGPLGPEPKNPTGLTARQLLRIAFDNIYDNHPYLSGIVCQWEVIPSEKYKTAATNGPQMYYNPEFLESLTRGEACWLMLHEAGHVFLGHQFRFMDYAEKERDAKRWNIATDLALNSYIWGNMPADGKLLDMALHPKNMGFELNRDAEYYYDMFPKLDYMTTIGPSAKRSGEKIMKGEMEPGPGEVLPHPSLSEGYDAQQQAEREWQDMVHHSTSVVLNATNTESSSGNSADGEYTAGSSPGGNGCGHLPGWVREAVDAIVGKPVKLDWKVELARLFRRIAHTSLTYERPNRRQSWRKDIIVPSRKSRKRGKVGLIVDTSGSMDKDKMNISFIEMEKIVYLFPECEIDMMQCDTRLVESQIRTFKRADFPLQLPHEWHGRGGTNLSPAFDYIKSKSHEYDAVICLTDMEWAVSSCTDPRVPTIWLSTDQPLEKLYENYRPKFGKVLGPITSTGVHQ